MATCPCRCHRSSLAHAAIAREALLPGLVRDHLEADLRDPGAPTTDAVEAVLACPLCVAWHCDALLERRIWGPRIVPPPDVDLTDYGEGPE